MGPFPTIMSVNLAAKLVTPVTWQKTTERYSPSSAIAVESTLFLRSVAKTSTALV